MGNKANRAKKPKRAKAKKPKKPVVSSTASRAVLLEQFDQGKSFEQALAAVRSELGADAMTDSDAMSRWTEFSEGRRALGASYCDEQLAAASQLLKNQRALQCEVRLERPFSTKLASSGRFFVALESKRILVIDSFHNKKRNLVLNASLAQAKNPAFPTHLFKYRFIRAFQFVDETTLLLTLSAHHFDGSPKVVVLADLDLRKTTLFALSSVEVPGFVHKIEKTDNPATFFCYSTGGWRNAGKSAVLLTINGDNSLAVGERIELPTDLYQSFCMYSNGTVYSFDSTAGSYDSDPKKLRVYSLASKQTTVRDVACPFDGRIRESGLVRTAGGCLLERSGNSALRSVFEFRLDTCEWVDSGVRVVQDIRYMTTADRLLVVVTCSGYGGTVWSIFRFAHRRAKKLSDLTWSAVVRRDEQEIGFAAEVVDEMPLNFSLRCPWIPVPKAEKRSLEPETDDEQAAGPSGLPPKQPKTEAAE